MPRGSKGSGVFRKANLKETHDCGSRDVCRTFGTLRRNVLFANTYETIRLGSREKASLRLRALQLFPWQRVTRTGGKGFDKPIESLVPRLVVSVSNRSSQKLCLPWRSKQLNYYHSLEVLVPPEVELFRARSILSSFHSTKLAFFFFSLNSPRIVEFKKKDTSLLCLENMSRGHWGILSWSQLRTWTSGFLERLFITGC